MAIIWKHRDSSYKVGLENKIISLEWKQGNIKPQIVGEMSCK